MKRFLFASSSNRIESYACSWATLEAFCGHWLIALAVMLVAYGISLWGRRRFWF